jgi:hypothetical protein
MLRLRTCTLVLVALLAAGCATQQGAVNQAFGKNPNRQLPQRVLLVQPNIRVHEISAGGVVEKVEQWSVQASDNAVKSLQESVQAQHLFELVPIAGTAEADKATLEQHAALYALVSGSAHGAQASPFQAWRTRSSEFDYTLGPGLKDVAERNRIDAAVFLVGTDYISSAGRKAAMVFGILAGALTGVVIVPASMPAFMSVGVVDMRSGDLLWYSTDFRGGASDLRDPAVMKSLIDSMLRTYPSAVKAADAGKRS